MKRILGLFALLTLFNGSCIASDSFPVNVGQAGGLCLAAWAPCVAFHQAYGEYLFQGTAPTIPADLGESLPNTRTAAQRLLLLLVEQPDPPTDSIVASTALLQQLEQPSFEEILLRLDEEAQADPELLRSTLQDAADAGLFIMILEIKRQLDLLVELLLRDLEADDQVLFSAAFIAEGLIAAPSGAILDLQWIEVLGFVEDAPDGVLPDEADDAVRRLIDLVGVPGERTAADWEDLRNEAYRLKSSLTGISDGGGLIERPPDPAAELESDTHYENDTSAAAARPAAATAVGIGLLILLALSALAVAGLLWI